MISFIRFLGRHARLALPLGVLAGILLPGLARQFQPLLAVSVVGTMLAAVLRIDNAGLLQLLKRPQLPVLMCIWLLLVSPAIAWLICLAFQLPAEVTLLLVLQAAASPIGSAAAFAMFLGLDGSLCLVSTALATLSLPVSLTAVVAVLLPHYGLQVDAWAFFIRTLVYVVLPFGLAGLITVLLGKQRLKENDDLLAGINVLLLVVFALAVMDGVTELLLNETLLTLGILGLAALAVMLWHSMGHLVFRIKGVQTAYSAALLSGNRNMGLMLVVTAGTAGPRFALYVALVQIPMYCAPLFLGPWLRRSQAQIK